MALTIRDLWRKHPDISDAEMVQLQLAACRRLTMLSEADIRRFEEMLAGCGENGKSVVNALRRMRLEAPDEQHTPR